MTIKKVLVSVDWQGRKILHLPEGVRYVTVAKFPEDTTWPKEAWSMVLEFNLSPKQQGNPSKASAHFLVEDAPLDRLVKGKVFELYEGKDVVAMVNVISE